MSSNFNAIYYSAPIPRNLASLNTLGVLFDEVHFPGVHLPNGGYDPKDLQIEIDRLKALDLSDRDAIELIAILEFLPLVPVLEGFCKFTATADDVFGDTDGVSKEFVDQIFDAIHGPRPDGWIPIINSGSHKQIPESEEAVNYPGRYHYFGKAFLESSSSSVPLVTDLPGIPLPHIQEGSPADDASLLSMILSIEAMKLVLPELPLLSPEDLMEFRERQQEQLRLFRRSMLRHAAEFNQRIDGIPVSEVEKKTKFYVETEISPALDELRDIFIAPARSWHKRAVDLIRYAPKIGAACLSPEPSTALAKVLMSFAGGQLLTEFGASESKAESLKRSGLYYLLEVEKAHKSE